MNPRWTAFLAGCLLALAALGDVTVNFRNNVLSGDVKVTFGAAAPFFGVHPGSPLVNGIGGRNYKAQLYWWASPTDCAPRPVGDPVNFRQVSQSDPFAGTWSGANRIIVGPPPDATVWLEVRVWDAAFSSFETAVLGGGVCNRSTAFSYRNKLSNPPATTDTYMDNFLGFDAEPLTPLYLSDPGAAIPNQLPHVQLTVPENGAVMFTAGVAAASGESAATNSSAPPRGRITGSGTNLAYLAPTNYYGVDSFELALSGGLSCFRSQRVVVTIQPSLERLGSRLIVGGGMEREIFILGLTNRTYRLQVSSNLVAWDTWRHLRGSEGLLNVTSQLPRVGSATYYRLLTD